MTNVTHRTPFGCDALLDVQALHGVPSIVVDVGANVGQTACPPPAVASGARVVLRAGSGRVHRPEEQRGPPFLPSPVARRPSGRSPAWPRRQPRVRKSSNTLRVDERRHQALISVEVTTVDRVLTELPTPRIDLLKVDTEGFEFFPFRGARHALANHLIELVLLERALRAFCPLQAGSTEISGLHREQTAVGLPTRQPVHPLRRR